MAIKPMVRTIPPMNDDVSKCEPDGFGGGSVVVVVVVVGVGVGAGVVDVVVDVAGCRGKKRLLY